MPKKIIPFFLIALATGAHSSCGGSKSGEFSAAALEQIKKATEISIIVEVEPHGLLALKTAVQNVLERVFIGLGLAVVNEPVAYPAFQVRISGDAVGTSYWDEKAGAETESYSGARIKGDMVLAQSEHDRFQRNFSGRIETPKDIISPIEDPLDAPFGEALQQSDFLAVVAGLLDSCWGREKTLAAVAGLYGDALPWPGWRLAVLRSLEPFHDDKATETLRNILVRHVEALMDPSADTAFDDCIVKLLDILIARNDRAARPAVIILLGKLGTYNHYGNWGDSRSYLQEAASRLK